ncbi:MAG: DUF5103 domain-containing protein [Bacteroidales bacterium]|nr:DUF5103 domain-containing protein [Bacteroidales bacterium]
MSSFFRNTLLLFIITFQSGLAICQDYSYETIDSVYKTNIRTVKLHLEAWELSYPIIELNGENKLLLGFDDLDTEKKNYSYTIIHCDADWKPSNLIPDDYIDGFHENPITDFEHSFNTKYDYIHYKLVIPNYDVKIKLSGNYILKVFEDFDQNSIVFTRRFMVVEPRVIIEANVKKSDASDYFMKGQEVDFTIFHDNYDITDPNSELTVVVAQNNRWDNAISDLQPLFIKPAELVYDYSMENVFLSGNEYRGLDLKNIDYLSDRIQKIEYIEPYYHFYLKPDAVRPYKSYIYEEDLNGKYVVGVDNARNKDVDADYVYVYFSLPYKIPIVDAEVYVFGELTNWKCNRKSQMKYNPDKRQYELMLLLKQGYYNYEYVIVDRRDGFYDNTFIEGSHFETENDYVIYVYHRDRSMQYDKLIGTTIVNSMVKGK